MRLFFLDIDRSGGNVIVEFDVWLWEGVHEKNRERNYG